MRAFLSIIVVLSLLAVITLFACRALAPPMATAAEPSPARLQVVATFSVLGDLVANVGGDRVALDVLVGPDGDAHTFEPTPRDAMAVARADVVFEIGLGFETWLDKLYTASGSKARRVVATRGISPRKLVEDGREETDPHVWHDVKNTAQIVEQIAAALSAADPAGARQYRANADAYLKQLTELDRWVVEETQSIPKERRKLVTSHDTFGYFAARYGFEVIGAGLSSITTEAADPSAWEIAELVRQIRKAGVPAIFAENVQNPKLMEQIAHEAKVKLVATLYTDALGPKGSDGGTYLKMMRYNVRTIADALKP